MGDFSKIPRFDTGRTWLEICRYPGSRFEEISSRILAFYLDPGAEHGMSDLWISAFLSAIGKAEWYDYRHRVSVRTEEYADGKRVDITAVADDYVVAVENKITAGVYNPLDVYREYIGRTYPGKKQALVVLSAKPVAETRKVTESGFLRCSYRDLFAEVNRGMGNYIAGANERYLIFMLDFMKTIDHLNGSSSRLEHEFFSRNREVVDELVKRYECYKAGIFSDQVEAIARLRERVSRLTGAEWWAWENWDLGVTFNEEGHRVGIESHFEEAGGNPVARFNACITTWRKEDWTPYREAVLGEFADWNPVVEECRTGRDSNRVFAWVYCNTEGDLEAIAGKLKEMHDKLARITSNIH